MRIPRFAIAVVVLLVPTFAHANDHRADAFAGLSFASGSLLTGLHGAFVVTAPTNPTGRHLAVFGDVSVHFGERDDIDVTRGTFLGGVRWSIPGEKHRHVPYVQVAVGAVRDSAGFDEGTHGAIAFGAGWDFVPSGAQPDAHWGLRVQADWVQSGGDDFARASVGVVFRLN